MATSESLVKSLSAENEMLKNKVAILIAEAENDKKHVVTLENSLQVEKDFCKLKDKQIGDLELKLQNVGARAVQDFKDSDEYYGELWKYYAGGFDILVQWMAKHHPDLDLSSLAVDEVEKELMSSEAITENVMEKELMSSEAIAENVMEEATVNNEEMKEANVITL